MSAIDYILDGLEAELALERELGVRLVECDRGLLAGAGGAAGVRALPASQPVAAQPVGLALRADRRGQETRDTRREVEDLRRETREEKNASAAVQPSTSILPFVFLHDRPLSPAGVEMMAKIITAMGTTAEKAPIVFENPVPRAKVYVVLGGLALRKFQPTMKGAPGMWLETAKGAPVLITYSPEYILRFKEITPAVKKIKQDMWTSLKSVLQRVR